MPPAGGINPAVCGRLWRYGMPPKTLFVAEWRWGLSLLTRCQGAITGDASGP